MRFYRSIIITIVPLIVLASCCLKQEVKTSNIQYSISKDMIHGHQSAFKDLTQEELSKPWGRELLVGQAFAAELDLYRAITCFKRAKILIDEDGKARLPQIEYAIMLSYYFGGKYREVIENFETSSLPKEGQNFPAYRDMLIILYDSYQRIGDTYDSSIILQIINKRDTETATKLEVSEKMIAHNMSVFNDNNLDAKLLKDMYYEYKKSPDIARYFNAFLPGLGYYYVGQKQSAVTSFAMNALFIAAAYHFFDHGNVAAGVITTGFEFGWYFGGINGAGIAAQEYNNYIFTKYARDIMTDKKTFPVLMLNYTF